MFNKLRNCNIPNNISYCYTKTLPYLAILFFKMELLLIATLMLTFYVVLETNKYSDVDFYEHYFLLHYLTLRTSYLIII